MKIQGWNMKSLAPKEWDPKDGVLAEDIQVSTFSAIKNNKRVVLHRVVKTNPDGSEEVFIIKASPKILETDH